MEAVHERCGWGERVCERKSRKERQGDVVLCTGAETARLGSAADRRDHGTKLCEGVWCVCGLGGVAVGRCCCRRSLRLWWSGLCACLFVVRRALPDLPDLPCRGALTGRGPRRGGLCAAWSGGGA